MVVSASGLAGTTSNKRGHSKGSYKKCSGNNDDDYTANDNKDDDNNDNNDDDDDDDDDKDDDYQLATHTQNVTNKEENKNKNPINKKVKNKLLHWEAMSKLNQLGLNISLRTAVGVGTRINQKVIYSNIAAAHKQHCFKPKDLVTSSSYN